MDDMTAAATTKRKDAGACGLRRGTAATTTAEEFVPDDNG
jgi:hypothetical protein